MLHVMEFVERMGVYNLDVPYCFLGRYMITMALLDHNAHQVIRGNMSRMNHTIQVIKQSYLKGELWKDGLFVHCPINLHNSQIIDLPTKAIKLCTMRRYAMIPQCTFTF